MGDLVLARDACMFTAWAFYIAYGSRGTLGGLGGSSRLRMVCVIVCFMV